MPGRTAARPFRAVLDTDIGTDPDDAYALVLAATDPHIELAAVTTVMGDTRVRAAIARKFLRLLGRDQVPVAAGLESDPDGRRGWWAGFEGKGFIDENDLPHVASDAPGLIIDTARASAQPTTVIAIGALSNVAAALDRAPSIAGNIGRCVIMGGTLRPIRVGGAELPPESETNLHNDWRAAAKVLQSGIPITLVPADVTFRAKLFDRDFTRIANSGSEMCTALANMTRDFQQLWRPHMASLGAAAFYEDTATLLHDPLAVLASAGRFVEVQSRRVSVDAGPHGIRLRYDPAGFAIETVTSADMPGVSAYVASQVTAIPQR